MSEGLSDENETIFITGFALFLFGSLVTLVSNLKLSECNDSLVPIMKFSLVITSLSLVLAICWGSLAFTAKKTNKEKMTKEYILASVFSLCVAIVMILIYLLLYITESINYTIGSFAIFAFCVLFKGGYIIYITKTNKNKKT